VVLKSDQAQTKPMQDERLQLEMLAADAEKQKPTKKRKHVNTWNYDSFCADGVKHIKTFIETRIQLATEPKNVRGVDFFVSSVDILNAFFELQTETVCDSSRKRFFYIHLKKQMIAKFGVPCTQTGWNTTMRGKMGGYKGIILLQAPCSEPNQYAMVLASNALCVLEDRIREEEAQWMLEDAECLSNTRVGFVYAAFNPFFGDEVKIGATMKDSPLPRLKELSRGFPHSFHLLACVPSKQPFALEKKVHAHFASSRLRKEETGRNTEYFDVSHSDVLTHFAILNKLA